MKTSENWIGGISLYAIDTCMKKGCVQRIEPSEVYHALVYKEEIKEINVEDYFENFFDELRFATLCFLLNTKHYNEKYMN